MLPTQILCLVTGISGRKELNKITHKFFR